MDTALFSRFGIPAKGLNNFYCVIDLAGDRTELTGLKIETFGDRPGIQGKNKIVNVTGSGAVLRDVEITTAGSSPWGYGSLFGISGGVVRKMNGIRVGWPAVGAKIIGCRVHMRAMGHAIFVQGASDTLIEDCHVDGLLRSTDEILAETSGFAFGRGFKTPGRDYVEGVRVGPDGDILPARWSRSAKTAFASTALSTACPPVRQPFAAAPSSACAAAFAPASVPRRTA